MTAKIFVPKVMKTAKTDISTNMDTKANIFCSRESQHFYKPNLGSVAEFERFGKRRFQSIHLKIGPESIEELIIIGLILL
jgi:hypothetical protein